MEFTKTWKAGRYTTPAAMPSGRAVTIKVEKVEKMNPTARGGAYRTMWEARYGADKATGETREEAVQNLIAHTDLSV